MANINISNNLVEDKKEKNKKEVAELELLEKAYGDIEFGEENLRDGFHRCLDIAAAANSRILSKPIMRRANAFSAKRKTGRELHMSVMWHNDRPSIRISKARRRIRLHNV